MTLHTLKNKKGFTLLLALVVVSIVLVISFAFSFFELTQIRLAETLRRSMVAFYTAESGVECARYYSVIDYRYFLSQNQPGLPSTLPASSIPTTINCAGVDLDLHTTYDLSHNTATSTFEFNTNVLSSPYTPNPYFTTKVTVVRFPPGVPDTSFRYRNIVASADGYDVYTGVNGSATDIQRNKELKVQGYCASPDVMLLLDASNSLSPTEGALVKDAAAAFADALVNGRSDGARLGQINFADSYNNRVKNNLPLKNGLAYMATGLTYVKSDLITRDPNTGAVNGGSINDYALDSEATAAGTNLHDALVKAQRELNNHGRATSPSFVVIFTDGHPLGYDSATSSLDTDPNTWASDGGSPTNAYALQSIFRATDIAKQIKASPQKTEIYTLYAKRPLEKCEYRSTGPNSIDIRTGQPYPWSGNPINNPLDPDYKNCELYLKNEVASPDSPGTIPHAQVITDFSELKAKLLQIVTNKCVKVIEEK